MKIERRQTDLFKYKSTYVASTTWICSRSHFSAGCSAFPFKQSIIWSRASPEDATNKRFPDSWYDKHVAALLPGIAAPILGLLGFVKSMNITMFATIELYSDTTARPRKGIDLLSSFTTSCHVRCTVQVPYSAWPAIRTYSIVRSISAACHGGVHAVQHTVRSTPVPVHVLYSRVRALNGGVACGTKIFKKCDPIQRLLIKPTQIIW